MPEILNHIAINFEEYLIVFLLVTLFFKESLMSYVNMKLGRETDTPEWGKKATTEINRLAEYANHDTTERLNRLIEMEEKESMERQEFRDSIREVNRTLQEIQRYGIPCNNK